MSFRLWITPNAIIALFVIVSFAAIPTITAVPAKFEPIVVAAPTGEEDLQYNNVQQESIKVEVNYQQIPEYLLDLNDSDIGGPVEYMPTDDQTAHKFISWDLLPPEERLEHTAASTNIKQMALQITDTDSQYAASSQNEATTTTTSTTTQRYNRGNVHFSNTTPTPRTTTTRRTTPSTTTTTRRTTTPRTTTSTTTSTPLNMEEYYRLEKGDSYTLPSWLAGVDYADLDVAVTFIVPTDNNDYNHTIERDIAPPLEPYADLKEIQLPAPVTESTTTTIRPSTTTTTIRTTTSTYRTPSSTTARSYWIQTNSNSNTKTSSFNNRVATNHIAPTSTTTTRKPNYSFSFNTIQNNNGQYRTTTTVAPFDTKMEQKSNPFLFNRQNTPSTTTSTTTTTTTTTVQPEILKNPFVPTLPTWLQNFDDPDVGPGVPFVYDPSTLDQNVDGNLQAPLHFQQEKPTFLTDTQSQINPSNQFPTTAASTALANSIQTDATATTSTFNYKNELDNQQKQNIPAPFEDDSSNLNNSPVKTTFSKGQGGKVITSTGNGNPFLSNIPLAASSNSVPAFAPTYRPLQQNFAAATTRNVFSRTTNYQNRFGGPPGILRPYDNVRV